MTVTERRRLFLAGMECLRAYLATLTFMVENADDCTLREAELIGKCIRSVKKYLRELDLDGLLTDAVARALIDGEGVGAKP